MSLPKETSVILLAPIVRGQKGEYKKDLLHYRRLGYEKLKISGIYYDFEELPNIDKNKKHDIELVVDQNCIISYKDIKKYVTKVNISDKILSEEEVLQVNNSRVF
jgi:excinuclease ABC subunit A